MNRDLLRETARATVDAAARAAQAGTARHMGATVIQSGTGYGAAVAVKLDGDPSSVVTQVVNATTTALPIGARVLVADTPTGTFVVGSNSQAGGRYLIASTRLTSAAASFTIASIPQCFQYLELVVSLRSSAGAGQDCLLRVNGLSTGVYGGELVQFASGGSLTGTELSAHTSFDWWCYVPGTNSVAGFFGQAVCKILNYNTATIWPALMAERSFWTSDAGVLNGVALASCSGGSTTAVITRLDLSLTSGNFILGSTFELYGIGTAL